MKNGTTYETTEAAEKNSVPSKRRAQQRNKRTAGFLEKVGKEQSHYLTESCKERGEDKSLLRVLCGWILTIPLIKIGGKEMKTAKIVFIALSIALLVSMPVVADAHWSFGGGFILGLGTGIFTGFAFAPRPVYVAPPVYYAPPPPVVYRYYPVPAPVSPGPATYGYSNSPAVSSANPPPGQSISREWKLINRHLEKRWDPYYGRWQNILVERWGWVGVPCNN